MTNIEGFLGTPMGEQPTDALNDALTRATIEAASKNAGILSSVESQDGLRLSQAESVNSTNFEKGE